MAALQTQTPCPDCDCSDSPLSVTGNVLGILTFVVALYASLLYYYRGLRAYRAERSDTLWKVSLAEQDLASVRLKYEENVDRISDALARERLDQAVQRAELCIQEVRSLLPERDIVRTLIKLYLYSDDGWWGPKFLIFAVGSIVRDMAAYLLEREKITEALGKMEASTRDLREVASDVFGGIPTETDGRVLNMVSVLEEIRVQNNGLRLVMDDVLRRVSALESGPGERMTEPRVDEEE